jgi:hypothetical protein
LDIPTFSSCIEITSSPQLLTPLTTPAVVFVCDYPPNVSSIAHDQSETVALHAQHPSPFNFTEALVEANGHCPVTIGQAGSLKRVFASLVQGRWREAGRQFGQWIQPQPLMAFFLHAGGGGLTGLQSKFQFALPCKMEIGSGDGTVATPGTQVPVTAHVTDLFGAPCQNANVHFLASAGGSVSASAALSDANGNANITWTIGAGANTLTASGFGIASPTNHGPRATLAGDFVAHSLAYGCVTPLCNFPAQTFDPFIPKYLNFEGIPDAATPTPADGASGVHLGIGALTFSATGTTDPIDSFGFGAGNYRAQLNLSPSDPLFSTGWSTSGFDDSAWPMATAPLNTAYPGCALYTGTPTVWNINTDVAVRKHFATSVTGTLTIQVRIDNDAQVFLDGVDITSLVVSGSGSYTAPFWVHEGCADSGNPVLVKASVAPGLHVLAIHGHDRGVAAFLDVKLDLTPSP